MAEQLLEQNERQTENVNLDLYNYILDLTYWSVQCVAVTFRPINDAQMSDILRGRAPELFKAALCQGL